MTDLISPLLEVSQAASYLKLSEPTLRRLRNNGTGPAFVQIGFRIFYTQPALDKYIETQTVYKENEHE